MFLEVREVRFGREEGEKRSAREKKRREEREGKPTVSVSLTMGREDGLLRFPTIFIAPRS